MAADPPGQPIRPHEPKKGALRQLHRLLIALAIALGAMFTIFSLDRYLEGGASSSLVIALVTAAATIAFALYLRWFSRKR